MEGQGKDEAGYPATEGHEGPPNVDELVGALKALESVDQDLDRLFEERPDLESLRPYLVILTELGELGEASPSSAASDLRAQLLEQVARWQAEHPSPEQTP